MPRLTCSLVAALTLAVAAEPASAQVFDSVPKGRPIDSLPAPVARRESPFAGLLGGELSVVIPRGDFRFGNRAAFGWGVRGGAGFGKGVVDLGGTFRSITRGSQSYGDTSVTNMMRTLAVDARIAAPLGPLRPYVGGSLGFAYFGTETSVEECCDENYETYNSFDGVGLARFTPMASTRVGFLIELSPGGRGGLPIDLDLGMETHHGGKTSYQSDGRGPVQTTRTGFRSYSIGVVLRSGR